MVPLLHTEIDNGARLFAFPIFKKWKPRLHAQSLDRIRTFCRQLFEVRCVFCGAPPYVPTRPLQTLEVMHAHSLAHRDLHPGNLLYDRSADRILLTDFGLSAYCAPGRHFFGRVGTEGPTRYCLQCANLGTQDFAPLRW